MDAPAGTTIIFKGGSFTGVLPASCEFADEVKVVATGESCAVVFQDGVEFSNDSELSLTGGTLTAEDAELDGEIELDGVAITGTGTINNAGELTITGAASCQIETLTKATGATSAISCATASGSSWNIDSLTTTGAASITTLTTSGAVAIGGNATGTTWTTGNLTATGSFNVSTLILNGVSSANVANVSTLTLNSGAALTISQNATVANVTLNDGAALTFADGAVFKPTSLTLSGTQTLNGYGYLVLAPAVATSGLTQASGSKVRIVKTGAGLTAFNAYAQTRQTIGFKWTATDSSAPFIIERQDGDQWTLVSSNPTANLTDSHTAPVTYRAFDGVNFIVNAADPTPLNPVWRYSVTVAATNGGNGTGTGAGYKIVSVDVIKPQL